MASFFNLFHRTHEKSIVIPTESEGYDRPSVMKEEDVRRYPEWLCEIINYNKDLPSDLHPTLKALESLIQGQTRIRFLAQGICDELAEYDDDHPNESRLAGIRDCSDLLKILNYILRVPPLWNTHMYMIGLEAAPFWLLFKNPMRTECGFAFFLDPEINATMKGVMNAWGDFLIPEAYTHLTNDANLGSDLLTFEEIYVCDPSRVDRGFKSWDDFFTRQFRHGVRPVASPTDDSIVVNACESSPWRITRNASHEDKFWVKGGAYSLSDMMADSEISEAFVGGTVYQAYLSALTYHRWHSPVNGTISRAYKIPGTYFSQPLNKGFGESVGAQDKRRDPNWEQAYLTSIATRAVILIDADNPNIGLMAVIPIGMGEVSSCEITVREGQRIRKGEQIGLFHFGGSTHCVLFRPGVDVLELPDPDSVTQNWPVNAPLARIGHS